MAPEGFARQPSHAWVLAMAVANTPGCLSTFDNEQENHKTLFVMSLSNHTFLGEIERLHVGTVGQGRPLQAHQRKNKAVQTFTGGVQRVPRSRAVRQVVDY